MSMLREFVADLLESTGAVVEVVAPDDLEVMAPQKLRAAWGWPELARLSFGVAAPAGSIPMGLEGDWLDRLGALMGESGRLAERQLPLPEGAAMSRDAQRRIDRGLDLPNAVWRLAKIEPGWSRCLLLAFRYTAMSDEKREGLVWLGFNCTTGATLDAELLTALRRSLEHASEWQAPQPEASLAAGPLGGAAAIAARTRLLLDHLVHADLEPFVAAMRRRLDRDRKRVHAYHDDLRRAALLKLAGLERSSGGKMSEKAETAIKRERMRVSAIEREYQAKLDDLRHNYALVVKVEWVQALVLLAPVQRHTLVIKRRKGERSIAMDWHAAARRMEPAPCDWGVGLARIRLACDDRLHLTDAAGQAPCPSCGKPFCRACHPEHCPRCRPAKIDPAST